MMKSESMVPDRGGWCRAILTSVPSSILYYPSFPSKIMKSESMVPDRVPRHSGFSTIQYPPLSFLPRNLSEPNVNRVR